MPDQILMPFIFQHIGLIRQYFPKGTVFGEISDDRIQAIENKLNLRPRKRLCHKALIEVLYDGTPWQEAVYRDDNRIYAASTVTATDQCVEWGLLLGCGGLSAIDGLLTATPRPDKIGPYDGAWQSPPALLISTLAVHKKIKL